jgi:hypothetical protein
VSLPNVNQAAVDGDGSFAPSWRRWFASIERQLSQSGMDGTSVTAAIEAIATVLGSPDGTVDNIPAQHWLSDFAIRSPDGTISVVGTPESGSVGLSLAQLDDSGVGASLVKLTRDAYGRVSGTHSATTDDLTEGSTNKYFTDERAQDAVAAMIAAGTQVGITFTYNDAGNALSATVTASSSTDIRDVWLFG